MSASILAANLGQKLNLAVKFNDGSTESGFLGIVQGVQTLALGGTDTTGLLSGAASAGEARILNKMMKIDPEGAGTKFILPAVADLAGYELLIYNDADAAESLLIRDSGDSTTIITLDQSELGLVTSDGVNYAAIGGSAGGSDFGASGISADVVAESTPAAGVQVDGLLAKDGGWGFGAVGVATAVAAGSGQGDAVALPAAVTYVTGADGAKGAVLPAAAAGGTVRIVQNNDASSDLLVYPASGDDIDDGTTDVAISLPPKGTRIFIPIDAATWLSFDYVDMRNAQTIAGIKTFSAGITLADGSLVTRQGAGTGTGDVIDRISASATEGLERRVFEGNISPSAIETNVLLVPANSRIESVQSNVDAALTGGSTTVTYGLGTAGDGDKYGTPSSDLLTQDTKTDHMGDTTVAAAEQIVLTGLATGGGSDGDTALTLGTVRVRIVYWTLVSLDNV